MKIASWNVNGIKARHQGVIEWLRQSQPDVACLQEIKSVDEAFPHEKFVELGYNVFTHGQKSFNGVAIFSKYPLEDVRIGLPGDQEDEQARYIEGLICPKDCRPLRLASLYLPNGNPVESEKYPYKLHWMARLQAHARQLLAYEEALILAGDFNVIPGDEDCYNPQAWAGDALYRPETLAAFRELLALGLSDGFRLCNNEAGHYSFWDYQGGSWQRNQGIRIDHLLLSAEAADRLTLCEIEKDVRGWEKPSDHVPIIGYFSS